jgi:hypothetical protein
MRIFLESDPPAQPGAAPQVRISVRWDYSTPEIEAYLAGLREIFPHWEWSRDA